MTASLEKVVDKTARPSLASRRPRYGATPKQWTGVKYLRASQDAQGYSISVQSQLDEGEEFFEEHGILDGGVFCDNDISASVYATEERPDYEAAINEVRSGRANLIWFFDASRGQRDLEIFARVRRILIDAGGALSYNGRVYDMNDPNDRKATARDAVEAENFIDTLVVNIRRGVRKRAKSGKHAGPQAYGYNRVYSPETGKSLGWVINWEQAKTIRRIVRWCLELKSLGWIARRLNEAGVPCARDGKWTRAHVLKLAELYQHPKQWRAFLAQLEPQARPVAQRAVALVEAGESFKGAAKLLNSEGVPWVIPSKWDTTKVRNIALSKAAAAIRIHHGQEHMVKVLDGKGGFKMVAVKAAWSPIVRRSEHVQLSAVLRAPERQRNTNTETLEHLWSGTATCRTCGLGFGRGSSKDGPRYRCPKGHASRDYYALHAYLLEFALCTLERPDAAEIFRLKTSKAEAATADQAAQELRAELAMWQADAAAGNVSRESFRAIEPGLLERIRQAEAAARRVRVPAALENMTGVNARAAFARLDIEGQRAVVRTIMRPVIGPSATRGKGAKEMDTSTIDPGLLYDLPEDMPVAA
ncbi:recombinase family protein [Kutzneria sp. NPDC051319]|uniref:recombinase family protein n=1 Tax=Kutzneria sp. NPDC051319 TaxID=3155047 RepID=UPI003428373A